MKLKYLPFLLLFSCDNNMDKNNQIITQQQKTIDSLESELIQYKILHSIGKEIIESDSSFTD